MSLPDPPPHPGLTRSTPRASRQSEIIIRPCPRPFSDHIYKTAHGVDIPLRVWPAAAGKGKRPWVLWFHGGALTFGKHYAPNPWVLPAFRARGYHVVSAGYRFIPHVGLPEIVSDSEAAYAWCRANLASALAGLTDYTGPTDVDADRYVAAGDSMGCLLSTLLAMSSAVPPKAVVCIYPFTDLFDDYMHPAPNDKAWVASLKQMQYASYSEQEIAAALAERDPRTAQVAAAYRHELPPNLTLDQLREYWGMPDDWVPHETTLMRVDMMVYEYAHRLMVTTLGRRERFGTEEAFRASLLPYSPMHVMEARAARRAAGSDVAGELYPPTYFLHGDNDHTVPANHSLRLASRLRAHGCVVEEKYVPGVGHSFDLFIGGPESPLWKGYIVPLMEFVDRRVYAGTTPGAAGGEPTERLSRL